MKPSVSSVATRQACGADGSTVQPSASATGWSPPRRPLIGFVALSSDSAVVGMRTSDGTDVIETPSSEARRGAVVSGVVIAMVSGGVGAIDTDVVGATVSGVVDTGWAELDAMGARAVAGCVELQPATRTAAISTHGLTRHRPYDQRTVR